MLATLLKVKLWYHVVSLDKHQTHVFFLFLIGRWKLESFVVNLFYFGTIAKCRFVEFCYLYIFDAFYSIFEFLLTVTLLLCNNRFSVWRIVLIMKRFVYINDNEASHDPYCDNRISNRKYTILNFLPKNLWEQFRLFLAHFFPYEELFSDFDLILPFFISFPLQLLFSLIFGCWCGIFMMLII